jgi:hypothetical protein
MYKITCKELTDTNCDFVAEGNTPEEAKSNFYAHGAKSPTHKAQYESATDESKAEFGKKVDEHLAKQNQ